MAPMTAETTAAGCQETFIVSRVKQILSASRKETHPKMPAKMAFRVLIFFIPKQLLSFLYKLYRINVTSIS